MNRARAILFAAVLVVSAGATPVVAGAAHSGPVQSATAGAEGPQLARGAPPAAAGTSESGDSGDGQAATGGETGDPNAQFAALAPRLQAMAGADHEQQVQLSDDLRQAATRGARQGARLAQRQGAEVTQRQVQAAADGAVRAAAQNQNASVEQVQAAAQGSTYGALIQSQSADVEQYQAAIYGASAGSLSQSQSASVTQIQSAGYGAAHGSIAQSQSVNVTQIQYAATGAAAGAANGAAQSQNVSVSQIQEAAQGSAYGSLLQNQSVSVTQIQAAAYGAAGGATTQGAKANAKQVQEASMGAAQGSLTQVQKATVEQVQAAARGSCGGALTQYQSVSVSQIQEATVGAARGAISQSQSASVTQIQAAAHGGARGSLTQVQSVNIVQIQYAAAGAASGAAKTAAQRQIVDVEQIQAAAIGASRGAVIQIQQISITQIQVIADSAASGALSQYQSASITQIQSAAAGAAKGAVSITQIQQISITQIQVITQTAASNAAATAARAGITDPGAIENYGRGLTGSAQPTPAGPTKGLQSLFASASGNALFLANPNDQPVVVTIDRQDGGSQTVRLAGGAQRTLDLESAAYNLTAETEDGQPVQLAGRDELVLSVGEIPQSLLVEVDGQLVTVDNPNDQRVTVVATQNGRRALSFDIPPNWDGTQRFAPGTYTLDVETPAGPDLPIMGEDTYEITIDGNRTPAAPIDLGVSQRGGNVSISNPGNATASVTVATDTGGNETLSVAGGENATTTLAPGNYTLVATAPNRTVTLEGQSAYPLTVEAGRQPTAGLNATADNGTLAVENPSEADAVAQLTNESGLNESIDVPAGESATRDLGAGNYTLTAQTSAGESLPVNGKETYEFAVAGAGPEPTGPINLSVSSADGNVTIDNPGNATVLVTATNESGSELTASVPANESMTDSLAPGNYTLTAETEGGEPALLDGQEQYALSIAGPPAPSAIDLNVSVDNGTVSIANPNEMAVTATVANDTGVVENASVPAGGTESVDLSPGNYTLTATAPDHNVTLNGQTELSISLAGAGAQPGSLDATVDNGTLTVQNPTDVDAAAQLTNESGGTQTIDVPAGESATAENLSAGNYTLSAQTADGAPLQVNGKETYEFGVAPAPAAPPIDVNATVANGTVTMTNPSETAVTATVRNATGVVENVSVPAGDAGEVALAPGSYTVNASAPDRNVTVNGQSTFAFTIAGPNLTSLNGTVDNGTVTLTNPTDRPVSVTLANESGTIQTAPIDAGGTLNRTGLAPGNYTVNASADGTTVPINGRATWNVTIEGPSVRSLNVTTNATAAFVENPNDRPIDVTFTAEIGEQQPVTVGSGENLTVPLPAGNYTVAAETADGTPVPVNGQPELSIEISGPQLASVNATVDNQTLAVVNPTDVAVTVTADPGTGSPVQFTADPGETTQPLDPGTYAVTAATADGTPVPVNNQSSVTLTVEAPPTTTAPTTTAPTTTQPTTSQPTTTSPPATASPTTQPTTAAPTTAAPATESPTPSQAQPAGAAGASATTTGGNETAPATPAP
ncbi:MAG: beta strand repeat-containing protein [Haloarculaceae archaeon]